MSPFKLLRTGLLSSFMMVLLFSCQQKEFAGQQSYDRVQDHAGLLSKTEKDSLTYLSEGLEKSVGSQLAIIIIDTLAGEKIETFSLRRAMAMGLGRKNFNDGLLITVSRLDRQIRIEVGTGLERIILDETASRVIREIIAPEFREKKHYKGLAAGVKELARLIQENKPLVGKQP